MDTVPCLTGRRFDALALAAHDMAIETATSVMLAFDDVCVQVDPGDSIATIGLNYDQTLNHVRRRLAHQPSLAEGARLPQIGDLIETTKDDHSTRVMAGTGGIVTNVEIDPSQGIPHKLVLRFGRRTVEYILEDMAMLRFIR